MAKPKIFLINDASALNALARLGSLPAPPNAELRNIVISFNSAQ